MDIAPPKDSGASSAKPRELCTIRSRMPSSGNCAGRANTMTAPAVMPSITREMTKNAMWYQVITLVIRVSRISSTNVASATRKIPV